MTVSLKGVPEAKICICLVSCFFLNWYHKSKSIYYLGGHCLEGFELKVQMEYATVRPEESGGTVPSTGKL